MISEALTGGPWICCFLIGQASITPQTLMGSANCCLITDFWVSQSFPSQRGKGKSKFRIWCKYFTAFFLWKSFLEGTGRRLGSTLFVYGSVTQYRSTRRQTGECKYIALFENTRAMRTSAKCTAQSPKF